MVAKKEILKMALQHVHGNIQALVCYCVLRTPWDNQKCPDYSLFSMAISLHAKR